MMRAFPDSPTALPLDAPDKERRPAGGEELCLGTSLPSESLPPGLAGLEQRDVVGPVLLPATEEEEVLLEEEEELVGLGFSRRRWSECTVARTGCCQRAGETSADTRDWVELSGTADKLSWAEVRNGRAAKALHAVISRK